MAKENDDIGTLDTIVDNYSIAIDVCPNKSKHVDRGMNIPSDMMFEHDTMFLVKRIAFMELGMDSNKIRTWSPDDCKRFYHEHKMSKYYDFRETFLTDSKSVGRWYFQGRSDFYMRFLEYRWNNSMVFTSYKERVDLALQSLIDEQTESTSTIIDKIRDLEEQKATLNNELKGIVASESMSDRLKAILSNVSIDLSDL
tara:strand:+ start:3910 stop:4503 length:594 start_codon:yes stop_codon:yes gene_type:complete